MTSPVSPSETIAKAMEGVTPEEIAAAWATWKSRHGEKLGPGPAFREAIDAALSVRRPFVEALALKLEAMQRETAELRHIGSQMANVLHHWKQRRDIAEYDRKQMAELQQLWDAIPSARTLIQGEKK